MAQVGGKVRMILSQDPASDVQGLQIQRLGGNIVTHRITLEGQIAQATSNVWMLFTPCLPNNSERLAIEALGLRVVACRVFVERRKVVEALGEVWVRFAQLSASNFQRLTQERLSFGVVAHGTM